MFNGIEINGSERTSPLLVWSLPDHGDVLHGACCCVVYCALSIMTRKNAVQLDFNIFIVAKEIIIVASDFISVLSNKSSIFVKSCLDIILHTYLIIAQKYNTKLITIIFILKFLLTEINLVSQGEFSGQEPRKFCMPQVICRFFQQFSLAITAKTTENNRK